MDLKNIKQRSDTNEYILYYPLYINFKNRQKYFIVKEITNVIVMVWEGWLWDDTKELSRMRKILSWFWSFYYASLYMYQTQHFYCRSVVLLYVNFTSKIKSISLFTGISCLIFYNRISFTSTSVGDEVQNQWGFSK